MQRDSDDCLVVASVVTDGLARGDVPQPSGLVRRGGHLVTASGPGQGQWSGAGLGVGVGVGLGVGLVRGAVAR